MLKTKNPLVSGTSKIHPENMVIFHWGIHPPGVLTSCDAETHGDVGVIPGLLASEDVNLLQVE